MVASDDDQSNNYVYAYTPSRIPLWVWAIVLFLLFYLFVFGIYFAVRATNR